MEYVCGRKVAIQRVTVAPFAVAASECNVISAVTLQGIHLFVSSLTRFYRMLSGVRLSGAVVLSLCLALSSPATCLDITDRVFEAGAEGLLAAFGDFNSDKLTDVFVVSPDRQRFGALLAHPEPPFLRNRGLNCSVGGLEIAGLVPGDFDGDAAMDVLVLVKKRDGQYDGHVAWGSLTKLACPNMTEPIVQTKGHPLALDYNSDMITDLFGLDVNDTRTFWIFNTTRQIERTVTLESNKTLRSPHSHAFVDLDGDMSTDLLLTTQSDFEVWQYKQSKGFQLYKEIPLPVPDAAVTGQSLFIDFNFDGKLDHIVPVCADSQCVNSSLFAYMDDHWTLIECDLKDPSGNTWSFQPPDSSHFYFEALTARSGDFNLDGYPDLVMTLTRAGQVRTVLLENLASDASNRKLVANWLVLSEWNNTSVAGAMYDIQEKGVLDVLLVHSTPSGATRLAAYKNTLDYDANFIKVLVLTGRCYANCSHGKIPYGTNLPGASISYRTTRPTGELQESCSAQLTQSAYQSLQLPYTLFGLARSPNFVEALRVTLSYYPASASREWTQIIPNSQMIIIPTLDSNSRFWLNKLFVTPSRAIALSAAALTGFGLFLAIVVGVLHFRERRADRREQLSIVNRFHFDAM